MFADWNERNKMQVHLIYTQREDGGFDHAVVFGDAPPWSAPEENVINCASETDAVRLKKKVEDMQIALSQSIECSVYERDVLPTIERAFVVKLVGAPEMATADEHAELVSSLTAHMR
jgi:hypothetical protein